MKKSAWLLTCFFLLAGLGCCKLNGGKTNPDEVIGGAVLPPITPVTRSYPKLVNYFHINFPENNVSYKAERLAQWDVLILNPDDVAAANLSLSTIRLTNPHIKILVWIPFGQEPAESMLVHQGIPGENDPVNWFARTTSGNYIRPHWGGHMMNPYKENFAWPRHVIGVLKKNYLDNGLYDGVMFDCLGEGAPTFASTDTPPTCDLNEDGVFDNNDHTCWQQGVLFLLQTLRTENPQAVITGNGGVPWTTACNFYEYANGNMHENALGNEFGSSLWDNNFNFPFGAWDGISVCINSTQPDPPLKRYHFLSVDIRMNRTQEQARNARRLSADDLRRMRLGLCTALLQDGAYFGFDRGDCLHGQLWWFDEYDAELGSPMGAYAQGVFGANIYSREFEHGIVVVNPNMSVVTITLASLHKDATNKQEGTRFSIPAHDGRIFVRLD
jgi:hypothetical protein